MTLKAPNSFYHLHDQLGDFGLRPVDPPTDSPLLHEWVTHPKDKYWMMQDATVADVLAEHEDIEANPHHFAFMGLYHYRARFLVEVYDPAHSELAGVYDPAPGDIGMHVLTAPTDTGSGGYTHKFFKAARSRDEVIAQRDAIAAWARINYGWMGRSPDYKAAFLNTLGANAEFYGKFAANARAWHKRAQEAVLYLNHALVNPPIDRNKPVEQVKDVYITIQWLWLGLQC